MLVHHFSSFTFFFVCFFQLTGYVYFLFLLKLLQNLNQMVQTEIKEKVPLENKITQLKNLFLT